jgi:hypothetical protein
LESTLVIAAYALTQVKEWIWRFRRGGFSGQDHSWLGQPNCNLLEHLHNLLEEFTFAPYKFLAGRLTANKVILARVLRDDSRL